MTSVALVDLVRRRGHHVAGDDRPQVLVHVAHPGHETHAGYRSAGTTFCGEPRGPYRARRGRGQHRPPSCKTCAALLEAATGPAAAAVATGRIQGGELIISC